MSDAQPKTMKSAEDWVMTHIRNSYSIDDESDERLIALVRRIQQDAIASVARPVIDDTGDIVDDCSHAIYRIFGWEKLMRNHDAVRVLKQLRDKSVMDGMEMMRERAAKIVMDKVPADLDGMKVMRPRQHSNLFAIEYAEEIHNLPLTEE